MSAPPVLAALCSVGLPGADPAPVGRLDAEVWEQLLRDARRRRVVALLALAARAGLVDLTPEQHEELTIAHEEAMRGCVLLERRSLGIGTVLTDADVPFRLLKGPGVARLDYPDPSWREFGDIDVLVRSERYDDAIRALERIGAWRRYAEVRPGFDRRFGKGVCMVLPDGVQVDVHRTFVAGPFGLTIDLDGLFAGPHSVRIGTRSVHVLGADQRFLHACYHAALGDAQPRLVALRDVAQMLAGDQVDFDCALAHAQQWRARIVVARAITTAWRTLRLAPSPESEWAAAYQPDRFEARSIAAYAGAERSYARQMAAGVRAVRGIPAKLAYVRSLLVVDPEYARRHDGGYTRRLRRAWQARNGTTMA